MEETNYEMDLLRENIHLRCFAHTIMNYRYHWHPDEYELSIVLQGTQEYCRGTETHSAFRGRPHSDRARQRPRLHAPTARHPRARPHFPASALKFLLKRDISISFLPASPVKAAVMRNVSAASVSMLVRSGRRWNAAAPMPS